MSAAPVEGKKGTRVSSLLEWLKEAEEEVEEDPGKGPSSEPPSSRKATGKIKRHGKESEEEGVSITTVHRPLKMTEIQGSRKELTRHPNKTLVTWLLRCWDGGASRLSLDGNQARQLGDIAREKSIGGGISRCLDGAATLWK